MIELIGDLDGTDELANFDVPSQISNINTKDWEQLNALGRESLGEL